MSWSNAEALIWDESLVAACSVRVETFTNRHNVRDCVVQVVNDRLRYGIDQLVVTADLVPIDEGEDFRTPGAEELEGLVNPVEQRHVLQRDTFALQPASSDAVRDCPGSRSPVENAVIFIDGAKTARGGQQTY
jgi:hypothetical protein